MATATTKAENHFKPFQLKVTVMIRNSVLSVLSRDGIRVILGAALGVFCWELLHNFQQEAHAQAGRITLQSLQAQIDAMLAGATPVGRAQSSFTADRALTADDAGRLGGTAAAAYQKKSEVVDYVVGQGLNSNRSGQTVTLSASTGYFDSRYLLLSGGTISGNLSVGNLSVGNVLGNVLDGVSVQGDRVLADFGVRVGFTQEGAGVTNAGLLRFNPNSLKLEVSNGSAWVAVH